MAKPSISANRATEKTIRAIDRKREQERKKMFQQARDHADLLATKLVQRLIDRGVIETTSPQTIREIVEEHLKKLPAIEDFDLQMKLAPVRTLVQDPNMVSLYFTQVIIEDLVNNPSVTDIYGADLDVYLAVDSIFKALRQQ
ncbi:MAG TPA: hypothetical protein DEB25_05380 [Desulfobulbaceae bacterium]|nr:hypothetical protein [Desulfobulbaceae bacterium]